jgi:DNA-binding transcriptional regulator WhiA
LKNNNYWTEERKLLLEDKYKTSTKEQLLSLFPEKSQYQIYNRAHLQHLKKDISVLFGNDGLKILLDKSCQSLYWMGFVFADGCLRRNKRINLSVSTKDERHIAAYSEYIGAKCKIVSSKNGFLDGKYEMCVCESGQLQTVNQIIDTFDLKFAKTYNPPNINILSAALDTKKKFLSFLAGYIDGNGSIDAKGRCRIEAHASWITVFKYFNTVLKKYYPQKIDNFKINKYGFSFFRIECGIIREIKRFLIENNIHKLERKWIRVKI